MLTDQDLRDIIMNFLLAGRDTTAQALSWMFYRLSLPDNKHIQQRAREEILEVVRKRQGSGVGGGGGDHFSYDELAEMKYVEAVCMETLRLHPSAPKEAKHVLENDVLPDGTKVFRGDMVIFSPWVMGRTERFWKQATTFNPDRFLGLNSKPSPFIFTAFQV